MILSENQIYDLVMHQLNNYWLDFNADIIKECIPEAREKTIGCISARAYSNRLNTVNGVNWYAGNSEAWAVFLVNLSSALHISGNLNEADYVFYLNKIMHAMYCYHSIKMPDHFWLKHMVGSVLAGNAKYGDYFVAFHGSKVAESKKTSLFTNSSIGEAEPFFYPEFGRYVILFSNAQVLGHTTTGDHVVFSAGSLAKNETIPDNCIVFGQSPNIVIKQYSEEYMMKIFNQFWLPRKEN